MRTPDLYPNSFHHKSGWIIIGLLTIYTVVVILLRTPCRHSRIVGKKGNVECSAYTPLYVDDEDREGDELDDLVDAPRRASGDSGLGAERPSSCSVRSAEVNHGRYSEREQEALPAGLPSKMIGLWLERHCLPIFPSSIVMAIPAFSSLILRILPILGFLQLTSGLVALTGIFVSNYSFWDWFRDPS